MAKKCRHVLSSIHAEGAVIWRGCARCHYTLSLGPSNDDSVAVMIEMEAAQYIQELEAEEGDGIVALMGDAERSGYWGEDDGIFVGGPGWYAGWLVHAYEVHDVLQIRMDAADAARAFDMLDADRRGEVGQAQLDRMTVMVRGSQSDAFAPADYATKQPWADPSDTTKLTDDELTRAVAFSPPGSVGNAQLRTVDAELTSDDIARIDQSLDSARRWCEANLDDPRIEEHEALTGTMGGGE